MKVLLIGGNGNISWHCSMAALAAGHEVSVLNRGLSNATRRDLPPTIMHYPADMRDPDSVRTALRGAKFDAVADFVCYTAEQARIDIDLFSGATRQFIFISSTAVYQRPPTLVPFTEATPYYNPHWEYARNNPCNGCIGLKL